MKKMPSTFPGSVPTRRKKQRATARIGSGRVAPIQQVFFQRPELKQKTYRYDGFEYPNGLKLGSIFSLEHTGPRYKTIHLVRNSSSYLTFKVESIESGNLTEIALDKDIGVFLWVLR